MKQVAEFLKEYKKLRAFTFIMILSLIAAAAVAFFKPLLSLLLLAAALIYHFAFLRKSQKAYTESVTEENLRRTTMDQLGAIELHKKDGGKITRDLIRSASLIPMDEGEGSSYLALGMDGKMSGLEVSVCDATIAESFALTKNGKHRVHHNAGAWFHIDLEKDTGLNVRILDEDAVPLVMKQNYYQMKTDLVQIPSGKISLPAKFYTYTAADSAEDIHISTNFIRSFLELSEYTPGKLAISIRGDKADVFLRNRFFAMPVTLSKAPTKESLSFDPMPELKRIVNMVKKI